MCDDGNQVSGDGCNSDCIIEVGYLCLTEGSACTCNVGYAAIQDTDPMECVYECPDGYVENNY